MVFGLKSSAPLMASALLCREDISGLADAAQIAQHQDEHKCERDDDSLIYPLRNPSTGSARVEKVWGERRWV